MPKGVKGSHLGVKHCKAVDCGHSARHGYEFCKKHGGGKRCTAVDCGSSARDGYEFCKKHGGEKCLKCDKPAQSRKLCFQHGGGTRCATCRVFCVRLKKQECWVCRTGTERAKQFEYEVRVAIDACSYLPRYSYYDTILPCAPNLKRGDFWFLLPDYSVVLEVDENMHKLYNPECEVSRLQRLHDQRPDAPLHVIRYNPHSSMPRKLDVLCARIKLALDQQPARDTGGGIHTEYIGYSSDRVDTLSTAASAMHAQALAAYA